MNPLAYATRFDRLRTEPTWRLLSANLAPDVLGLLRYLLYDGERTVSGPTLLARLTTELDLLRTQGRDLAGDARYYLRDWVTQGWLERRLPEGGDEELYELSAPGLQALRIIASLDQQREAATESRLSLVMSQLQRLSRATETDPMVRLEQLYEERRRIDAEIDAVASGEVSVLDPKRALADLREILNLARDLSEDFQRVRDRFTALYQNFRERIIQEDGQRGKVLAEVFDGVDVIAQTEEGQAFHAFWSLLIDPEQSALLEASIDALSRRDFASTLPRDERLFLSRMTRTLLERAGSVNDKQTGFARSLRSFVQSHEYKEQRRLTRLLQSTKADGLAVRAMLRPENPVGYTLQLSSATFRSLGQWKLHVPVQGIVPGELEEGEASTIELEDIAAAVQESDIDFRALADNVRQVLDHASQVSIGGLLAQFPATQGLGTVVGYLALGVRHGVVVRDQSEAVGWEVGDRTVCASIPMVYFVSERKDEVHG
ncbi:MAG: hypothetical protein A2580_06935 [Hydrogenophilales bacterium RIFOXYD1_FULL_62_11]|nr:MAG: hypothetical protein A2580_06935 [Hydrogenophilales bacterium RIFOXYD1_FULL_62_11]